MAIEIVPFSRFSYNYARDLNYEWLMKFFTIEPNDRVQLENPLQEIIGRGGHIFYALYDSEVAGTFSLLPAGINTFELGKMATTERFKGLGIGTRMLEFAIEKSKELRATTLILFSNTRLLPAIHLYKKFGFYEVPLEHSHYLRSDIKMEKMLNIP